MQTKTIEHKLQKITIEYGYNDNPWTDEDEALVEALEMMYDEELRLNKETDDLMTDYFAAERNINAQRNELVKVTFTLSGLYNDADGFREYFGLSVPQSFIEFSFQVTAASKQIADFRAAYMEYSNHEETLQLRLDQANQNLDDITLWDEYDIIQTRHFDNREANSIDFVKYMRVEEEMRNTHSYYRRRRKDNLSSCDRIHDESRCLALEVCMQVALWNEFLKRFTLLGYIFGEKNGLPGVWEN